MKVARKVRLYPNKAQKKKLFNAHDTLRAIHNYITECLLLCDDKDELLPQFFYWYGIIKDMYPSRLFDTPATAINGLCNAQKDRMRKIILERKKKKPARARFNSYAKSHPISLESNPKQIKLKGNKISFSGFPEGIKFLEKGTDLKGAFKNGVSYSRFGYNKSGKCYASIIYDKAIQGLPKTGQVCSIDIGSKTNVAYLTKKKATNKGVFTQINLLDTEVERQEMASLESKIKRKTREYSKMVEAKKKALNKKFIKSKDHSYRMRVKLKEIARLMEKKKNKRHDWLHKLTTKIIKENGVICVESLNIKGMTRSRKGTKKSPGKMVKQKSGFNRAFLEFAPSLFLGMLKYKAELYGREVKTADKWYPSTKTCSACGDKKQNNLANLRLNMGIRTFKCQSCGFSCDRDENACRNLIKMAV